MGDISKPNLVDLMNLFIDWGMTVLKRKWLDRIGYHWESGAKPSKAFVLRV